jgi:NAD(P)-dependent dehydrogenase (short-subunit alcohol dehydrogenase family)
VRAVVTGAARGLGAARPVADGASAALIDVSSGVMATAHDNASKAGVLALIRQMAVEWGRRSERE